MEYYSGIKKNEIMPPTATQMDLEMIRLSEVSQKGKDKDHMISLIGGNQKLIQMKSFTKQKQTHRLRKQTYGYQRGKVAEGINEEVGIST